MWKSSGTAAAVSATLTGDETTTATFGLEVVGSGGVASHTIVSSGGVVFVSAGGRAVSTIVDYTGIGYGDGDLSCPAPSRGGTARTVINNDGEEAIFSGGTDVGAIIHAGGGAVCFL